MRKVLSLVAVVALVATVGYASGAAASHGGTRAGTDTSLPGFSQVVFLSHVNDPAVIRGFPGPPAVFAADPGAPSTVFGLIP